VHDLGHADGGQVTIALIAEDHPVWQDAFDAGCHRRGAPVGGFNEITGEVVVSKHRAADRRDADRALGNFHLIQHFRDQAVRHAMRAAGTVMGREIGERLRALIDYVFWFYQGSHKFLFILSLQGRVLSGASVRRA
jgi:hypothetical protein